MSEEKRWYEHLFDFFMETIAKQHLADAGASGDALKHAATVSAVLPTFAPPNRQPPAGVAQSRDLADCHPELLRRYLLLKDAFQRETGHVLFETCTWRSQAEQQRLYAIGRSGVPGEKTVTQLDGVAKKSRHMVYPAEAIDVCVDMHPGDGKHPVPEWARPAYAALGPLAAGVGLVWGGLWHIDDYPHLELPPL